MITGINPYNVRNINNIPYKMALNTNSACQNPIKQYNPNTIFKNFPIPFLGTSFQETLDYNYFHLPKGAKPDKTQVMAAKSLHKGDNTVCIAPTGTGKTAIANYAIANNLEKGKKTYYTTPLKALSNDKYREFCKLYGEENVGLLTGDIKLKKDAPVVIMTTEIFRNMALSNYANPEKNSFEDVGTVVFDEAHYINEDERGKIWEESIMLTPSDMQILPLTATIGNAAQFSSWIAKISDKKTNLVEASPKERYVPLVYYNYAPKKQNKFQELVRAKVDINVISELHKQNSLSEKQTRAIDILKNKTGHETEYIFELLKKETRNNVINNDEFAKILEKTFKFKELEALEVTQLLINQDTRSINKLAPQKNNQDKNDYSQLIEDLKKETKLPAIIFKFSRQGCNIAARETSRQNLALTTDEEKEEIRKIIDKYKQKNIYLGKNFDQKQLENGVASHNAGLMPGYKKLVEDLFSKKLLKVVFATSTLGAGINMPAKTVVITELEHPSDDIKIPLTTNEFHQMSGRAGRRGIDTVGNVVLYALKPEEQELANKLILRKADDIISKYEPCYNFLTSYYQKSSDEKLLDAFIGKTLKIHQAGDYKDTTEKEIKKDFDNHKKVLDKLGFIEKTEAGYKSTIKGEMLSKVHGYNELTLIEMIKSKKLSQLNPMELASFAASMVDIKYNFEPEAEKLVPDLMIGSCENIGKYDILDTICDASEYDEKKEDEEIEFGVSNKSPKTNIFNAYIGHKWTTGEKDSIETFKNLLSDPNKSGDKDFSSMPFHPFKKVTEGQLYNLLSQSVDVLKQIINVCEFALVQPELQNDSKYYEDLLQNAQEAVNIVKRPPIYDGLSVA